MKTNRHFNESHVRANAQGYWRKHGQT